MTKVIGGSSRFPNGAKRAYEDAYEAASTLLYKYSFNDDYYNNGITEDDYVQANHLADTLDALYPKLTQSEQAYTDEKHTTLKNELCDFELLYLKVKEVNRVCSDLDDKIEQYKNGQVEVNPDFLSRLKDHETNFIENQKVLRFTLDNAGLSRQAWEQKTSDFQSCLQPIYREIEQILESQKPKEEQNEPAALKNAFNAVHDQIYTLQMNLYRRNTGGKTSILPRDLSAKAQELEEKLEQSMSDLQKAYNGQTQFYAQQERLYETARDQLDYIKNHCTPT